jgi:hypothetical protein
MNPGPDLAAELVRLPVDLIVACELVWLLRTLLRDEELDRQEREHVGSASPELKFAV